MPEPATLRVKDAPVSTLPRLLVEPPWTREPRSREPVVLKLKAPKEPTTMTWAPGQRDEWLQAAYSRRFDPLERLPEDTDWEALAETFFSGRAIKELDHKTRRTASLALLLQAPPELGEKLLADRRYWDDFGPYYASSEILQGVVARHGIAAHPLALHAAANARYCSWLTPYLDADVGQIMIKNFGGGAADWEAAWFKQHGQDAARLTIPDALRKPGPKRQRAEAALRLIAEVHGPDTLVEAARFYGEEAAEPIAALKTDPLDLYPDPLPEIPEEFDPARLPQLLLRGREHALPSSATRHFITMLAITPSAYEPYPGVTRVVGAFDPDSLAEFAWALYKADKTPKMWACQGVQYLLINFANDAVADRLAPIVARWPKWLVWEYRGVTALRVFTRLGTDAALRHLHHLAGKAQDQKRIRPLARDALDRIAKERELTTEQLADRLVPGLGLDADGGMTLDYGRRRFVVGFDEQLKPLVTDEDGKIRKSLPKPGVKDDPDLAPAAYKRFAALKKDARTIAADQLKRLEKAMVSGRGWTPEEFQSLFVRHPLLRHIARRLVWSASEGTTVGSAVGTTFRIAEDQTLATADDDTFTLPATTKITLSHPLLLTSDELSAWAQVLADYEILQPFEQLGRPVHHLTDEERKTGRLERFNGRTVHFGRFLGLTGRGWELGEKEDGGFRRQVMYMTPDDRHIMVHFEPGISVIAPDEYPEQEIRTVTILTGRYSGAQHPIGDLDPVTASELLTTLTRLTGPAGPTA